MQINTVPDTGNYINFHDSEYHEPSQLYGLQVKQKFAVTMETGTIEIRRAFELMGIQHQLCDNFIDMPSNDYKYNILSYNLLFEDISHDTLNRWLVEMTNNNKKIILTQLFCDESTIMCRELIKPEYKKILKPYISNMYFCYTGVLEKEIEEQLNEYQLVNMGSGELWDEIDFFECRQGLERTDNFLLTMILQNDITKKGLKKRIHRPILKNSLENKGLLEYHKGAINIEEAGKIEIYDTREKQSWLREGFPWFTWRYNMQWPLYEQVSFEIVPETCYEHLSFPTEKTFKPMVASIPFLILSNQDYYNWLHSMGFRTFNTLIDESFAYEHDLEKRIHGLTKTARSIIDQGSLEFYHAASDICKYNREHLMNLQTKEITICKQKFWNFYTGMK